MQQKKKDILGKTGEDIAAQHLKANGYKILYRNWKMYHYEIDIIAEHDNRLVIVEVKTRATDDFGDPRDFVSRKKQGHLVRAAQLFAEQNNIDAEIRFDVIAIVLNNSEKKIEHIVDAFIPLLGM